MSAENRLRYADPDWHIRLRLHGDKGRLLREVLPELLDVCSGLMGDSIFRRLQLDTYEREVERYGGPTGMILAERLFHADSDAVLDLIETIRENPHADARWRFALAGIDRLLADLGMDVPTRRAIVRGAGDRFGKELRIDDPLERQIGDRYRKERPALESLLGLSLPRDEGLSSAHDFTAFTGRSLVLQPVVAELRQCEQAGRLTQPLVKLAGSFIHMHANRILRSAPREQEFVLYDFLGRLYDSQAARQSAVSKSRVADCF